MDCSPPVLLGPWDSPDMNTGVARPCPPPGDPINNYLMVKEKRILLDDTYSCLKNLKKLVGYKNGSLKTK